MRVYYGSYCYMLAMYVGQLTQCLPNVSCDIFCVFCKVYALTCISIYWNFVNCHFFSRFRLNSSK